MEFTYENGEWKVKIGADQDVTEVFGALDAHAERLREHYRVELIHRQDEILIRGDNAEMAGKALCELFSAVDRSEPLDLQKVDYIISLNDQGISYKESRLCQDILCFTHKGKPIKPKTLGQTAYAKSIRERDIVFGVGPAGTGKTYLAVAMAVTAFKNKEVEKIILARPAVEAGERLGFLPGDLQEKVDPYLRPLYDALYDILGRDSTLRLREREVIEVVPLAYMRGRTLDNAFIILDEAQNTTREQMKMFLTRLGFGSKAVVTGDLTQIDLPKGKKSGLKDAVSVLKGVKGIDFCFLEDTDVVRHALVRRIIQAYDRYLKEHPEPEES